MESKNGFPNQEKQDPSKDVMMQELGTVDPKTKSEEKSSTITHHSYFRNFSRNIKDVKVRIQERVKNIKAFRVIIFAVILTIIGIFSIPIILYYALKSNSVPELNSAFTDVNITMVNIHNYTMECGIASCCVIVTHVLL